MLREKLTGEQVFELLCDGMSQLPVPPYRKYSGVIKELNELAEGKEKMEGTEPEGGEIAAEHIEEGKRYVGGLLNGKLLYLVLCEVEKMDRREYDLARRILMEHALGNKVKVEDLAVAENMVKTIVNRSRK